MDEALVVEVKSAALRQGVTLVAYVSAALRVAVGSVVERQPARAAVSRIVAEVQVEPTPTAAPVERVRHARKEAGQSDYIGMKPSDALRAIREASYNRRQGAD
jgi:hypothetical protein